MVTSLNWFKCIQFAIKAKLTWQGNHIFNAGTRESQKYCFSSTVEFLSVLYKRDELDEMGLLYKHRHMHIIQWQFISLIAASLSFRRVTAGLFDANRGERVSAAASHSVTQRLKRVSALIVTQPQGMSGDCLPAWLARQKSLRPFFFLISFNSGGGGV